MPIFIETTSYQLVTAPFMQRTFQTIAAGPTSTRLPDEQSQTDPSPRTAAPVTPTTRAQARSMPATIGPTTPAPPATPQQDDVIVTGDRHAPGDPLQAVNAKSFAATEAVDRTLVGPVSLAYKHTVPSPVRSGIHNFLYNLREPIVFLNFVAQLKPGKAAETVGRFVVNSTVGVAGVVDVAKRRPFHLPRRANGFADTLGYYGVPNGPFLFLPLVGPTTVRDLAGGIVDRLVLPLGVGSPFNKAAYTIPAGVLGALDHRAEFDEELHILHDDVASPYANTRAFYLERRQAEIDHLHGKKSARTIPVQGTTEFK